MHNSDKRIQEVVELAKKVGRAEAALQLAIKPDTVRRYELEAIDRQIAKPEPKPPYIIILDVENAPTKAGIWRLWKTNIPMNAITDEWFMLSWAIKRLFSAPDDIQSDVLTPEEAINKDDTRIMQSIWMHIDAADIIIGHNLDQFDIRKINTRCVIHDIQPPMPYQTVDTLMVARKQFGFTSNRLDYLAKQFGVARKADNGGMERWLGCCDGVPQDLLDMVAYNKQDLIPTEEIYLKMLPYMKAHPNMGLYFDGDSDVCYKCGSTDLSWPEGKFYHTGVNKYSAYRCNQCKSPGRSRFSAMSKDDRRHLTSAVAR